MIHPAIEEDIARSEPSYNGSGPLWAYGSAPAARLDAEGTVFATVPDASRTVRPLCNSKMRLFMRRPGAGWETIFENPDYDQREPCPVALLPGGRVLVSINPRVAPFRAEPNGSAVMWYCSPLLLEFDAGRPRDFPRLITPVWDEPWPFTDHSYRGIAADPVRGEVLLLNIEGNLWRGPDTGRYHWCLIDAEGRTGANGVYAFPVRACYPAVLLRGRAAHVLAVSDIAEPNPAWAAHKKQVLGMKWDYDFRRLYLAGSPDLDARGFGPPLLVDDADETAGYIRHLDMLCDQSGDLHILYLRRNVWKTFMRDRFFPGLPIEITLQYARARAGAVIQRRSILSCREDASGWLVDPSGPTGPWGKGEELRTRDPLPTCAGLHIGPGGRVMVLVHQRAVDPDRAGDSGMFLIEPDGPARRAPVTRPLDLFQAVTDRNGSVTMPGAVDIIGASASLPETIRFASIPIG